MADYKKLYFSLFNKLTDLNKKIVEIQKEMEEQFILQEENHENNIQELK